MSSSSLYSCFSFFFGSFFVNEKKRALFFEHIKSVENTIRSKEERVRQLNVKRVGLQSQLSLLVSQYGLPDNPRYPINAKAARTAIMNQTKDMCTEDQQLAREIKDLKDQIEPYAELSHLHEGDQEVLRLDKMAIAAGFSVKSLKNTSTKVKKVKDSNKQLRTINYGGDELVIADRTVDESISNQLDDDVTTFERQVMEQHRKLATDREIKKLKDQRTALDFELSRTTVSDTEGGSTVVDDGFFDATPPHHDDHTVIEITEENPLLMGISSLEQ